MGNNEIYELFQSAWSGAMYVEETEEDVTADKRVYRVNDLGQGELINADIKDALGEFSAKETQLDTIVDEIRRIYDEENCPAVKKPWLPMLPDKMYLDSHHRTNDNSRIKPDLRISIGCVDIPELQEQEDYIVDLETQGNIVYVASPGFGKTVFLETVIMNLVQKNRVKDINLYILDFGNNALIGMSSLPHTADYVMLDDIEKYDKFRNIIAKEMRERKRLFAAHMVQNFSVYNEICDEPLKAIVVIIDNYDAIKEMGFEMEEYYTKLTRDGGSLGIYTIITASRSSAVRMATMNNFKNKIAGFSFDEMEAKSLVGRCSYTIPETKGRAYVKTGDNVNIMQIYAPFAFEDEVEFGRRITEETEKIRALYPEEEAPHIPMLPEDLSLDNLKTYEKDDNDIVLGLDKENVVSAGIRMNDFPFIILGEAGSGKTNAIRLIMEQLADDVDIHLFDSRSRSLISYKDEVDYIVDVEAMEDFLERLPDEIRYRDAYRDALIQGTNEELDMPSPMLIVIDDLDNLYDLADSQMQLVGARLKKAAAAGIPFHIPG